MRRSSGPQGSGCDGSWGFQEGHAMIRHPPYYPEQSDPSSTIKQWPGQLPQWFSR